MRWLSISALTLLLVGCQCFTRVTVSGSLAQGIVFQAPVGSDLAVGKAELEDLMVVAVGAGESQPVWHIKGKGRIDALKYGVVPAGMSEDAPAKPLEPGHTYIVGVWVKSRSVMPGPSCRGHVSFAVGADGRITSCYEEGSACG
jgi:hypothetical protein